MFYYENGKKVNYNGENKELDIIEWFRKKYISVTHSLKNINELEEFTKAKSHRLIYFGNNKENIKQYENYIKSTNNNLIYGLCRDESLINKFNKEIQKESLVLFNPFENPKFVIIKDINKTNIDEQIKINQTPYVFKNLVEVFQRFYYMRQPGLFFFRDNADPQKAKLYDDNILELGKKYRNKLNFWSGDYNNDIGRKFIQMSNLTKLNNKTHVPEAAIYEINKGSQVWRSGEYYEEFSIENFNHFVQSYIEGKIVPPPMSEEPVKVQDKPVFKLVNKTFENDVINNDLNVLVKFYSPSCPHCKRLEPTYIKLAEKLATRKDIRIAEMDLTKNDFYLIDIRGFPTLYFWPKDNKDKPIPYRGDRSLEDLLTFLFQNTK